MPQLEARQLTTAREHLHALLDRLVGAARTTGREMAVDALCSGLEAIPVPVLNTALSKTVRRLLAEPERGPSLDDIVSMLEAMLASDGAFEDGLRAFGLDLEAMAADITAIRAAIELQAEPRLRLLDLASELRWPVLDNRLTALIANTGGGSVIVGEITVTVDSWEPERRIDYSVPAAPLADLHLRAQLRSDCAEYPLLALNGEPARIYNERGAGAERLLIDLTCDENVRFALRLRLYVRDLTGAPAAALTWPAADEPALSVPFCVAPGWRRLDPAALHDRAALLDDLNDHLSGLADVLEANARDRLEPDELSRRMRDLGIPEYVLQPMCLRGFLVSFIAALADLAAAERRPAHAIATRLLAAAPPEALDGLAADQRLGDSLRRLAA